MEKRQIGIDIDGRCVRVAIVTQDRAALIAVGKREYADQEELVASLHEMIGDSRAFGDRLAAAVPALESFVRRLTFPFADPRKIEPALRFELAAQLPVQIEDFVTDFQAPRATTDGLHRVTAAAVRTAWLESFLTPLDAAGISLHILDLAPFAFVRGLREHCPDALLAHLGNEEISLSVIVDGQIVDYRSLPAGVSDRAQLAPMLLRETTALQREEKHRNLPFFLIGPGVTPELMALLHEGGVTPRIPHLFVDGREIEAEFLPAVALALRASVPAREREFNFRRGPFALKNEWTAFRRELFAAAVLLLLTGLTIIGASYLNYAHKANRADALSTEINRIFQQTLPGSRPTAQPMEQMQSKLRELRDRGQLIGAGQHTTALLVLREISAATPGSVSLDIRDISYTPESVRLEGVTTSFDAINQIARALEASPLFAEAQIADAKMSLDNTRVDFRLNLVYNGQKE